MWENLIQKLKSILSANTLISEVFDYEEVNFKKDPTAVIVPSDNSSEFVSNIDNERVYAFDIYLFVERGGVVNNDQRVDMAMRELVDSVIDDLDKNWQLTGLTLNNGYSMLYMESAPSSWGYASREMLYRMAQIKVSVHLNIDIDLIS